MQGRLHRRRLFRLSSLAKKLANQRTVPAGVLGATLALSNSFTASAQSQQPAPGLIAYNKPGTTYDDELWLTHPDGTGATVVPVADCSQCPLFGPSHPTWTRDGRFIAVTGLMQGNGYFNGGVALTYFDTSKPTKPVKAVAPLGTLDAAGWAAFSPDGSRLAYRDVQPKTTDYLQC